MFHKVLHLSQKLNILLVRTRGSSSSAPLPDSLIPHPRLSFYRNRLFTDYYDILRTVWNIVATRLAGNSGKPGVMEEQLHCFCYSQFMANSTTKLFGYCFLSYHSMFFVVMFSNFRFWKNKKNSNPALSVK